MPVADVFYLTDFENTALNDGTHLMIWCLDPNYSLKKSLEGFMLSHAHLKLDVAKKYPVFASKAEAQVASDKVKADLEALNPERLGAEKMYDEPNRILQEGKPQV